MIQMTDHPVMALECAALDPPSHAQQRLPTVISDKNNWDIHLYQPHGAKYKKTLSKQPLSCVFCTQLSLVTYFY